MTMTGNDMRELRQQAGLTQADMAEHVGLSRKAVNQAERLETGEVPRRTEFAVRAITFTGMVRSELLAEASEHLAAGDDRTAALYERAARLLTGTFVPDGQTIKNLALSAASLDLTRMHDERDLPKDKDNSSPTVSL